jgi:hypothetical protein
MRNERADQVFQAYQALVQVQNDLWQLDNAGQVQQNAELAVNAAVRRVWALVQEVWEQEGLNGQQYVEVVA